jgi:hypothetical protein
MKKLIYLFDKFLKLKRHLHGLSLPATLIILTFMLSTNTMQFNEIGVVGVTVFSFIWAFIAGFAVEAYQAIVKGANRTKKEMTGAKWDIATVVIGWGIGLVLYYLFGFRYFSGLLLLVICIVLEVYRLIKKKVRLKRLQPQINEVIESHQKLIDEYNLIREKKSNLSASQRQEVIVKVNTLIASGHINLD